MLDEQNMIDKVVNESTSPTPVKDTLSNVGGVGDAVAVSPTFLEQMNAKKAELLEIEKRLDEKTAILQKEMSIAMMSGRGIIQTQQTNVEDKAKEDIRAFLKNTGIDPFKGKGAQA